MRESINQSLDVWSYYQKAFTQNHGPICPDRDSNLRLPCFNAVRISCHVQTTITCGTFVLKFMLG